MEAEPDPFSLRIADVDEALLEHNIKTLKQGRYSAAKTTLPSKLSCLSKTPDRFESSQDASSASTLRLKDIAVSIGCVVILRRLVNGLVAQAEIERNGFRRSVSTQTHTTRNSFNIVRLQGHSPPRENTLYCS